MNLIIVTSLAESIVVAVNPSERRGEAAVIQLGVCLKDHESWWLANDSPGGHPALQHGFQALALAGTFAFLTQSTTCKSIRGKTGGNVAIERSVLSVVMKNKMTVRSNRQHRNPLSWHEWEQQNNIPPSPI